ncbi:hypothetical protein [Pseudoteredinibacter isoporae]|uniref:hypothetical protein n=1 Tax=Pseudoteredinibacter isoporae TaxID=570281 RepID=UPI00333FACE1
MSNCTFISTTPYSNGMIISFEWRMPSRSGKDDCLLKQLTEKISKQYLEQETGVPH